MQKLGQVTHHNSSNSLPPKHHFMTSHGTSALAVARLLNPNIDFPFEPVDGTDNTGPFEFVIEKLMDLESYFTYLRSWSAYQTAKDKGVELLTDDVIDNFKRTWNEDGQ
ncbi:hypothetical protein EZV62_005101 [Acer yangbiense]|uniref:Uncharacterized protein n=1 Tax=Acer yangbiense TaxID=1000413 RepID=A0A5C7INW4_9ROSI|nr:hypothetical protein EZV62_005101 [Acer yangbiense]